MNTPEEQDKKVNSDLGSNIEQYIEEMFAIQRKSDQIAKNMILGLVQGLAEVGFISSEVVESLVSQITKYGKPTKIFATKGLYHQFASTFGGMIDVVLMDGIGYQILFTFEPKEIDLNNNEV